MLEKLIIKAFKDETFGSQVGEDFVVQINPEKQKLENPIKFVEKRATEGAGVTTKFVVLDPRTLDFTLYFDDTGAVPPGKKGAPTDIKTQIDAFKKVAFDYNGEIHKPNYLKVIWGSFEFKCHLTKFTLNYTLFKPDGTPLRADATVTFKEYLSPEAINLLANKNSPDLTHIRTVKAGDSLPLMCYHIYGHSKHYVEVAAINNLTDFRALEPGTQIVFPPLAD